MAISAEPINFSASQSDAAMLNANASGDEDVILFQVDRRCQCFLQALGDEGRIAVAGDVRADNHEFIACEASDGVGGRIARCKRCATEMST